MRFSTALRGIAVAGMVGGLAVGMSIGADAQERVRWKLASSYASSLDPLGANGVRVTENIRKMSDGRFDIHFYEPGALVPALQVFDAVSAGSVDASYTSSGFHAGKIPAVAIFAAVPFGPNANEFMAWMHFGGGLDLQREIYGQYNVTTWPCGIVVAESSGWFREEIKSLDDLKGLKMRFFGYGARVMEKFGVSTQLLAPGDIYPALELGTLDATEFSYPSLDKNLGFHQVAKHNYFPGWHQQASLVELIVNKPKYDELPESYQTMLGVTCGEANMWAMANAESKQGQAIAFHKQKGVQIHTWPPEILDQFRAAWDEVAAEESAKDPLFKKVYDNYLAFRETYGEWRDIGYLK